jgi:uncharacterized protein (DUF1684 family)
VAGSLPPGDVLDLLDWKRQVFDIYSMVRQTDDRPSAWLSWRRERDGLFARHPQSPIPAAERDAFEALPYFDYDPAFRVEADIRPAAPARIDIAASGDDGGTVAFTRFGTAAFDLDGAAASLDLFWLDAYGGGLFLPFRDATSGGETYGAGRYLLDTVKGSDLGVTGDRRLVLDFNFAYNPSCSYDPRWVCPLAPPGNRLDVPVRAGERHPWRQAPAAPA